jgi:cell division protein FtsL
MDEEEKAVNRKTWLIFGIIILLILLGVGAYYIFHQREQMKDMTEMFTLEKEALSDEYEELSLQYEGYKFSVSNDSLVALLTTEQAKIQRLQEELRTVKSTNARRINELKKELETLRKVMRNYVIQIDSLDAENKQLKNENRQVTQKYQQAASTAARLSKEKEQLTERVAMAAKLDAVNIQASLLTAKGKAAKGIGKAAQLMLSFIVSKNITAAVGEQTIYVRLMKPDDDILTKPNSGRFMFENKEITYSMKKTVEYDGEEQHVVMYWNIEEYLSPGTYRVDIFTEENLMGRKSFTLEK